MIHTLDGVVAPAGVMPTEDAGLITPLVGAIGAARGADMGWVQQKQHKMKNRKRQAGCDTHHT